MYCVVFWCCVARALNRPVFFADEEAGGLRNNFIGVDIILLLTFNFKYILYTNIEYNNTLSITIRSAK